MMMNSADSLIGATEMSPSEASLVHQQLMITPLQTSRNFTVEMFAKEFGLMPMLVARKLLEIRPEDHSLRSVVTTNEFLIKAFGKNRVSRDLVEGGYVKIDKFWRNNDPLGVYRPGDMFYVDDNHPWMPFFPLLIFAPTVIVLTPVILGWIAFYFRR